MRGRFYNLSRVRPVGEIWADFVEDSGIIKFGMKLKPKDLGMAMVDFGEFLMTLPDDTTHADYDEGDMSAA